eukprot:m.41139 g.41139  ORF g.41139 m.41139 type:complete len:277 (-) comp10455_c0_seq1:22-852(-)
MAATVGALLSGLSLSKPHPFPSLSHKFYFSAIFRGRGDGKEHRHDGGCCSGGVDDLDPQTDKAVGFQRSEMFSKSTQGTVSGYDRHVFVAAGHAEAWPAKSIKEFPLAEQLAGSAPKSVKVTLFEDHPGNAPRVLVFPPQVAIAEAAAAQAPASVLDGSIAAGAAPLPGLYFFVCSHTARDARCGACGPRLVTAIRRATTIMGVAAEVFKCSHIGGHDMAGNVLVFYRDSAGKGHGDWYGYVTPTNVVDVIAAARNGEIYEKLWRGSMRVSDTLSV